MLGNFNPSEIKQKIYDFMDDYLIGMDTYEYELTTMLADFLGNKLHIEYNLYCFDDSNGFGGICAVAFIDNGHPQMVTFEYHY